MPLQDVVVTIDVLNPASKTGLGTPVIFVQKTGAPTYKEYFTLAGLKNDFADTTPVYKKADYILKQRNKPSKFAVATYDTDLTASLTLFANRPWHFALVANDLLADQTKLATFMNTQFFRFGVLQAATVTDVVKFTAFKRVAAFYSPVAGEHLDAAAVGELGSQTVGSITWNYKPVVGITPQYLTDDVMAQIDNGRAIAYVMKAGREQLSEGWLTNGEFIDDVHGQDWVKADMENEIQNMLAQMPKLSFDSGGIGMINGAMTTSLQRAYNNGIVGKTAEGLPNYTVVTLPKEAIDPADRAARRYTGASFSYGRSGGIHNVTVKGQVLV